MHPPGVPERIDENVGRNLILLILPYMYDRFSLMEWGEPSGIVFDRKTILLSDHFFEKKKENYLSYSVMYSK